MNNIEIFTLLKTYFKEILSVLGGIGMFFIGKRARKIREKKEVTEVTAGELENVEAALKIYRVMLDDLQVKLTEAQKAYTLLEERFQVSLKKNQDFKHKISTLETENQYLTDRLKNCKE